MGIINREIQEDIIKKIENIFAKNELMPDEKLFIVQALISRINMIGEKQKMADLMEHQIGSGLLKSMQKRFLKQEDEEGKDDEI